jgi:hypothetical protein
MPADSLRAIISYDMLLAAGVTCCLLAIVLRGFHQSNLRAAALRNQKARMNRVAGKAVEAEDAPPPANWFVRHLPLCYRTALAIGIILVIDAMLWR